MKKVKMEKQINKNNQEIDLKELVDEVLMDFKNRSALRKDFESLWQLNINFFLGNQYCVVDGRGDITDNYKQFFWEERQVYNHIAPLIDLRLSKLNRVRPKLTVIPFSDDQNDIACAEISKKLLKAVSYDLNISKVIADCTTWSEICGTSFYKIGWNGNLGRIIASDENNNSIKEGKVVVETVSPFEIYPDSNAIENIDDCESIIFARAFNTSHIKNIWGIDVDGKDVDVFSLDNTSSIGGLGYNDIAHSLSKRVKKNQVLVIEKYEKPSTKYPDGRLIIVAGDKLVYIGELPYINETDGKRGFPFIKQCSIKTPNCFWGTSIIERCIPIQRAYNAVKNRKHEFLNRLSMGILAVEDGSLDTENLEEEGLSPGKILIYRQGANLPQMISNGSVPIDFQLEENQLLNEFWNVSGINDITNNKSINSNISGVALQLLIEQDEVRLTSSAEEIRTSAKEISKHILRLYKQFSSLPQNTRIVGENGKVEMMYWQNSDINSEDIVFETENEINESLAQKRSMIFELLQSGLLHDETGKLSNVNRQKILQQLGFGIWESEHDVKSLHIDDAQKENIDLVQSGKISVPLEIQNHDIHINEHTCFMLSEDFEKQVEINSALREKMLDHLRSHRKYKNLTIRAENMNATLEKK